MMADTISGSRRSENMRRIRSCDTGPELVVRRVIHRMGFRFRLHRHDLPGKPDLVFPRLRKVVFVHGCFWHQHKNCIDGRLPRSGLNYWGPKLHRNTERDKEAICALRKLGWKVHIVWECETDNINALEERFRTFLNT